MAITLNDTLKAAQDGASHHIVIDVNQIDGQDIPFDGAYLTRGAYDEKNPSIIMHSTARVCALSIYDNSSLQYLYSNPGREEWIDKIILDDIDDLGLSAEITINSCSIVELSDATLGIIYICYDDANYYIRQAIISLAGVVASNALIATYDIATYPEVTSPWCLLLAAGTYLLVYIVDTSATASTIYMRTSADFLSWSAQSSITPAGISTEAKHNCSLCQITNDDIFLCFDYENASDITNCYYSISSDDGSTWGAAVAITSYATEATFGRHPVAAEQTENTLYIAYDEQQIAKYIDETTADWPGGNADITSLHVFGDYLYAVVSASTGTLSLIAVLKILIDDFTIADSWTTGTTPAFSTIFGATDLAFRTNGHEKQYIIVSTTGGQVAVLNTATNVITEFYFFSHLAYSVLANTDWTPDDSAGPIVTDMAFAVIKDGILYAMFYHNDASTRPIEIISLDLNQVNFTGSGGHWDPNNNWKVTQVYFGTNILSQTELTILADYGGGSFRFFNETNIAMWSIETSGSATNPGKMILFETTNVPWTVLSNTGGYDGGAATAIPYNGPLYADYYKGALYMTFPYQSGYGQTATYSFFDMTGIDAGATGYHGGAFDGRYVYFAPAQNPNSHGLIARYDTQGDFSDSDSWAFFDATTVDAHAKGFVSACFDGQYVYYCPYDNGVQSGFAVRYDTTLPFDETASYETFDIATKDADALGFKGVVVAGNYIFYIPYYNGAPGYSGHVARYARSLDFSAPASWDIYDLTDFHSSLKGFKGGLYAGHHLYFVPYKNGASTFGQVVQYDIRQPFGVAASYKMFDMTTINADAKGYNNAIYDGRRYIYFVPYMTSVVHGLVARYDREEDFEDPAAWSFFDIQTLSPNAGGFVGAEFDGRYIIFSPAIKSGGSTGLIARYDTEKQFDTGAAWSFFNMETLDAAALGFRINLFDGRFIYFVPYGIVGSLGTVARLDTWGSFSTGGREGICRYDLATGDSNFIKPGWATDYDDYKFSHIKRILGPKGYEFLISGDYGLTRFNPETLEWILYDSAGVPGMTPDDDDTGFFDISFDPVTSTIFAGKLYDAGRWEGIIALNLEGLFSQPKYKINIYSGSWALGSAANLITGTTDRDAVLAIDPDSAEIYCFWVKIRGGEWWIKFDKEFDSFDLAPYIPSDTDIIIERTIDNKPARISFMLARGHLFDEGNIMSMLRSILKKGVSVSIRVGETVAGTDYYQEQGTFIVKNKDISYKKGTMPTMAVSGEDLRTIFEDMELLTTSYYDGEYPETIIEDILENKGGITSTYYTIDTIDDRSKLYVSWADSKIIDILNALCDRYGYFMRLDSSNVFRIKKISDKADIDHYYLDRSTILDYVPDNNFSDFVNRIIVQSEERLYRQVVYPEKEIQISHGTIGWWQGNEELKIAYSDDYSLQCINPYPVMKYLSGNFLFGGGKLRWEFIPDSSNTFGTLRLLCPVMIDQLIAALATALATDWIPLVGGAVSAAGWLEIINILASTSNWQATIMGQPIAYVRAAIEGIADDVDFQTRCGRIVTRTLEEPMAYTAAQCQLVADHEMMVTKLQRNRVTIRKIGHLQDEEGDTIQIIHPISQDTVTLFVTGITRKIRKPSQVDTVGGMYDTIEGWVID